MAKTFFHTNTDLASGVHGSPEEKLQSTTAPASTTTLTIAGIDNDGEPVCTFTTTAGEPNAVTWATGVYTVIVDCLAIDTDTAFGFGMAGGQSGHIARVDSGLTSDLETHPQAEALFTTPGLKSATYTGAWSAVGTAADRFECFLVANQTAGMMAMGGKSITLRFNGDAKSTGPWAPPGPDFLEIGDSEINFLDPETGNSGINLLSAQTGNSEIV